jgi:hypothetical protein
MKSVLQGMALSAACAFLVACSLQPVNRAQKVTIHIDAAGGASIGSERYGVTVKSTPTTVPGSLSGFDCLGVNVTGPGIPDSSQHPENVDLKLVFDRLLRRESYCSYRGILAGPLVPGVAKDIQLVVPPGPRIIQLVGFQQVNGSNDCQSEFDPTIPRTVDANGNSIDGDVFETGRVVVDLFADQAVSLSSDWDPLSTAQKFERFMSCEPPPSTGGTILTAPVDWGVGGVSGVSFSKHGCYVAFPNVYCRGENGSAQTGSGATSTREDSFANPVSVSGNSVAAGGDFTCALAGVTVSCWGNNSHGQIATGSPTAAAVTVPTPIAISGSGSQITAGLGHACALRADNSIMCWGANGQGQLGVGDRTDRASATQVSGITNATQISAGANHTCALLMSGTVECWGDNSSGQLGDGTRTNRSTSVSVAGLSSITAIAAGGRHTCALDSGGAVYCWGANTFGQLGNGTFNDSTAPVAVSGITGSTLAAGLEHTCAQVSGSTIKCWGSGLQGQLGTGSTAGSNTPVPVTGAFAGISAVMSNGISRTTCLRKSTQTWCWGDTSTSQVTTP